MILGADFDVVAAADTPPTGTPEPSGTLELAVGLGLLIGYAFRRGKPPLFFEGGTISRGWSAVHRKE